MILQVQVGTFENILLHILTILTLISISLVFNGLDNVTGHPCYYTKEAGSINLVPCDTGAELRDIFICFLACRGKCYAIGFGDLFLTMTLIGTIVYSLESHR